MTRFFPLLACAASLAFAGAASAHAPAKVVFHPARMVAYDAKDRRIYSVAWARAHKMHDKGGDPLVIVKRSSLPPDAKPSRAMGGKPF